MKRASYRDAIDFIALNDEAGTDDGPEEIYGYTSVLLVACIFAVDQHKVAADVHKYRQKMRKENLI